MINRRRLWQVNVPLWTKARVDTKVVRSNNFIKNLTALREEHKLDFLFLRAVIARDFQRA